MRFGVLKKRKGELLGHINKWLALIIRLICGLKELDFVGPNLT